ncbi:MAG: hypothetical protein ACRCSG_09045 [Cellulosilyticaceae bacterium]
MKIKKEFIPLILSGEKKYEFRKKSYLSGLYKIEGRVFKLVRIDENTLHSLAAGGYCTHNKIYPLTKEEFEFMKTYIELDKSIFIYK